MVGVRMWCRAWCRICGLDVYHIVVHRGILYGCSRLNAYFHFSSSAHHVNLQSRIVQCSLYLPYLLPNHLRPLNLPLIPQNCKCQVTDHQTQSQPPN